MDRRKMEISLGMLVIASLAVLGFMALKTGHLKGLVFQARADVVFDNAAGLVEGAAVRVAGVQVGRVERLVVDFDKARATLLLDGGAELREDAIASVRARSLLGEKYVELTPQSRTAPLLGNNSVLQAAPSGLEVDQVISELGPLLRDLDLKPVGPLLHDLQSVVSSNKDQVTQTLERLARLLERLEQLKFDDPALQGDVRALVKNLRTTSEALPGVLQNADRTLTEVSARATPVLDRLDRTLASLEPTLAELPATLERLNSTLARVDAMAQQIQPILTRAESINYDLLKKLLREEGLLIRFRGQEVPWPAGEVNVSAGE